MTSASIESLTARADFQATSDPAVAPGQELLTYDKLYQLWERQQWATQDLDFTQDRIDWHERIEPEDQEALVEAITLYHMVIEGSLALTGQHFIIDYNERMGTLPAFVEGFTNVARDEHRHVAFGARFLRDMADRDQRYKDAIQRTLVEVGPVADGVLRPKWVPEGQEDVEFFGSSVNETRAFAAQALTRRLKVIGLQPAAA